MRLTFIVAIFTLATSGCSSRNPTLLDGSMADRRLVLNHAHHHSLVAAPGSRAQLKLVLTSAAACAGPPSGQAASALTVALDLASSDPARAEVTDVVFKAQGRSFWGKGTMLLSPAARAAVSRLARGASAGQVPSSLSGHLILSFYADHRRGGDRLGWLEGDFHSRPCEGAATVARLTPRPAAAPTVQ